MKYQQKNILKKNDKYSLLNFSKYPKSLLSKEFQDELQEESILFFSIVKWVILASVVGIITGFLTSLFLKALNYGIENMSKINYFYLALPFTLFLNALISKYFYPSADADTTNNVISYIHKIKKITIPSVIKSFFLPLLTIISGGSAGKEAPAADIGAGVGSLFGTLIKFNDIDRKKLMICGVSAGFSAVFGTPVAGAIFGIEVLFVGSILYEVMLPSFIAGIISYQTATILGITYYYNPINFTPVFSEMFFLKVILAGIFFGIVSFIFIKIFKMVKFLSAKINIYIPLKGIIGGIIIIILVSLFSTDYLGLSLKTVDDCLNGKHIEWYAFILKPLFTAITLSFGGSGGIVTTIFFSGATAGTVFAYIFKVDLSTFSAIGFVSLLAGVTNTPIASSILSIELFGPKIAPYATISCVISFLVSGHRSIYSSQVLSIQKSSSIKVKLGENISNIQPVCKQKQIKFWKNK